MHESREKTEIRSSIFNTREIAQFKSRAAAEDDAAVSEIKSFE
jgi:hypothetical protein